MTSQNVEAHTLRKNIPDKATSKLQEQGVEHVCFTMINETSNVSVHELEQMLHFLHFQMATSKCNEPIGGNPVPLVED